MKNVIRKISTFSKSNNILKEQKNTFVISNLALKNGKIENGFSIIEKEQNLPLENILYAYKAGGRFFVYTENENVYECKNNEVVLVGNLNSRPSVISITKSGEEKVLVAGRTLSATLVDQTNSQTIDFYSVDRMVLFGGRLFSTIDNLIQYTKLYDFTNEQSSFAVEGTIKISEDYGKIQYMCVINGTLYVFTDSTVFGLESSGESIDFKFKRLENLEFAIEKDTAIKVCDNVLFVENGKLFKFSKGEVVIIDTILTNGAYEIIGMSASGDNKYYLPIKYGEKKGVFIYDLTSNEQSVIECQNPVVCDGGYLFDISLNKVSKIEKSDESQSAKEWKSEKTDFGTFNNKVIHKIFVKSKGECVLTVYGDFGKNEFKIIAGNNGFIVNLPSKEYQFSLSSTSPDFCVENLTVNYRERGK